MASRQLGSSSMNLKPAKRSIAEDWEVSSRQESDDRLRSVYFESEDDSDRDCNGCEEDSANLQSSTKRKRQWSCDDALQMTRFEFTKHGLMGIVDEMDDQVDRGSPLGELYLDTKREIITFFYDFNKRQENFLLSVKKNGKTKPEVPSKSKFGIVKQCRAVLKDAAMSWYDESTRIPQSLPPKSHILACRFICDYGELDGTISKFLLAIGRYDLAQISEHSGNFHQYASPIDGTAYLNTKAAITPTVESDDVSRWQARLEKPQKLASREKKDKANGQSKTIEATQATIRSNNSSHVEQLKVIREDFTERVGELQKAAEQINSTLKPASQTVFTPRKRPPSIKKRTPSAKKTKPVAIKTPKIKSPKTPTKSTKKAKSSIPNFDELTFDQIDPFLIIDHSSDSDYEP